MVSTTISCKEAHVCKRKSVTALEITRKYHSSKLQSYQFLKTHPYIHECRANSKCKEDDYCDRKNWRLSNITNTSSNNYQSTDEAGDHSDEKLAKL